MDVKNFFSKKIGLLLFLLSYTSLIISFFLNEDGTGSGARGDFEVTYGFILALQENLLADPKDWTLVHTPLHFIILSYISLIFKNPDNLRLLFCIFSIILPFIFFKIFRINKNNKNLNNLLVIASCIFLLPAFRYTSIWANDLITSTIFFLFSIFYFKKWELNQNEKIDTNIFLQFLFLVLAVYTRQYFAVFFIYFLYRYFLVLKIKSFINLFILCVISSIPVFVYVYYFPELLTGQHISAKAYNYFLLGNSSIMSLYIYPIILINFLYKKIFLNLKILKYFILSTLIVFFLSLNFNPIGWQGGGINLIISQKIFNSNIYFYLSSVITFTFFFYLFFEDKKNIILILLLLFMFFSYQVYQRYYEPMFFIIFFTLFKTKLVDIFTKEIIPCFILFIYYLTYYFCAVTDILYKIN